MTSAFPTLWKLTQAQLNLTAAAIDNLSAKYDYQSAYATLQYTYEPCVDRR